MSLGLLVWKCWSTEKKMLTDSSTRHNVGMGNNYGGSDQCRNKGETYDGDEKKLMTEWINWGEQQLGIKLKVQAENTLRQWSGIDKRDWGSQIISQSTYSCKINLG